MKKIQFLFWVESAQPLDLGDVPDPPLEGVGPAIYRGGLVQLGLGQRRWRHLHVVASRDVEARLEVSVARREVGRRGGCGLCGLNDLRLERKKITDILPNNKKRG